MLSLAGAREVLLHALIDLITLLLILEAEKKGGLLGLP